MNDHLRQNFGVCMLMVMFFILTAALVHMAHFVQDGNGTIEALKINLATVVGGIVGIVTGSKLQQRSTDVTVGTTPSGGAHEASVTTSTT